ncbi:hypothetical protein IC9_04652 [Bacillus toyonensis]|nr:hypothetical protein bcere0017_6350 [Bacillus cereus Rock1-3]EJQ91601.1 hypothetical protein IGO_00583 [Bacillus toyonensis]MDF9887178.1 hypothetical protein [Bacillus sp. LEw-kw-24]MDH6557002.1 hypothetical protein [Bacillus sp. LEw-kw-2]MDH8703521.1 hypothetical protein [Stenotrophomonas sp. 1198]MDP9744205.1 hypothetical protein [Bacillus thuringiensis]
MLSVPKWGAYIHSLFFLYIKGHFYEKERKDKKTDERILIIRNVSV